MWIFKKLADKYFFDVYLDTDKLNEINQPKPNSFDETILNCDELNVELERANRDFNSVYPTGSCNIPLYVLTIQIISFGRNMRKNLQNMSNIKSGVYYSWWNNHQFVSEGFATLFYRC